MRCSLKKLLCFMWIISICAVAAGCSKAKAESGNSGDGAESAAVTDQNAVDVDLSALNSIMMTGQINEMMLNPEDYVGKVIKTTGMYSPMYYDVSGEYIHYAGNLDPTGCCFVGLEFMLGEDCVYPDDYPEENTVVTLVGTYDSYEDVDGETYYYIAVDELS